MKPILLLVPLLAAFSLPTPAPSTSLASQPRGEHDWNVDPVHSSVVFRVKHAGVSWFQGTFDRVDGTVKYDPDHLDATEVALQIPVDKVDSNDARRDDHLKSPDFFNAKESPDIRFVSTKVVVRTDGKLDVTGDLSMVGVTKPITMVVEKSGDGDFMGKRVGWWSTFVIKRSDFGLGAAVAEKALGDEIMLSVGLETTQGK